ncbi:MAG: hypothetical protein QXS69_03680 [Candidatus Aenigmatarchaeota archaeon]
MEIKVLQEKNNNILKRKELIIEIDHTSKPTPSREELANEISNKFNVDKDKIEIDYILSYRGLSKAKAKIKIYEVLPAKKHETQNS